MSLNTVSVRLTLEFGPTAVVRTAHRLGIASKLEPNASIALGTSEVSVIELVGAYAPFANGGFAVAPHVVERVRTADGKTLYTREQQSLGRIIEPRYVAMMNAMMQETLLTGTARKAELRRLARRRQDRHLAGFPRRLVRRLHRPSRHRRLARQRRQLADQEDHRRRPAGRDLEPVHEARAPGRARSPACPGLPSGPRDRGTAAAARPGRAAHAAARAEPRASAAPARRSRRPAASTTG